MENHNVIRMFVAAVCCVAGSLVPAKAVLEDPNAADLVRAIRKTEMWLHDCESLHIRVRTRWTNTPEGIARRRAEIKEESGIENPDVEQFSDLRQTHEQSLEFAMDRKRVRLFMDSPGHCRQVKVWDGNELRIHEKYYDRTQE